LLPSFGTLQGKPGSGKQKDKRTPENIEIVELVIEEASTRSIWPLAQQMELSYGTCQVIPKKDLALYPYELAYLQELHADDFPLRANVCIGF
jgi:hypothetical protein